MEKVFTINSKLEKAGIATQRVIRSVDCNEDDCIEVNDKVHVQSGDGYITVYANVGNDNYLILHATNANVVDKVKYALTQAR
jgi:hypothetical protein